MQCNVGCIKNTDIVVYVKIYIYTFKVTKNSISGIACNIIFTNFLYFNQRKIIPKFSYLYNFVHHPILIVI